MSYQLFRFKIHLRYYAKLTLIHANKHQKLARVNIAARLIKLGFWVSSDFRREFERSVRYVPIDTLLDEDDFAILAMEREEGYDA